MNSNATGPMKAFDEWERRRQKSVIWEGKRLRPLPCTIYVNCRDKRLSLQVRKDHLHPKEIIKKMRYQVPGRPAPIHSTLLGGANHREVMA
jgi:hypothetical protein